MLNQLLEFKAILQARSLDKKVDKDTRQLLLYLFTSTRGGLTRLRIIMLLLEQPCNTHQIAQDLEIDYKAIQHHMKVLEKNNLVVKTGSKYGAMFNLSEFLEVNLPALIDAIEQLDRKLQYKKVYI